MHIWLWKNKFAELNTMTLSGSHWSRSAIPTHLSLPTAKFSLYSPISAWQPLYSTVSIACPSWPLCVLNIHCTCLFLLDSHHTYLFLLIQVLKARVFCTSFTGITQNIGISTSREWILNSDPLAANGNRASRQRFFVSMLCLLRIHRREAMWINALAWLTLHSSVSMHTMKQKNWTKFHLLAVDYIYFGNGFSFIYSKKVFFLYTEIKISAESRHNECWWWFA